MRVIEEAAGETLKAFIRENISKGSKIITDGLVKILKVGYGELRP
jgi:hypothetical protein